MIQWNSAAERIFDWTRAEMLGQPFRRLLPRDMQAQADRISRDIFSQFVQQRSMSTNLHRSGRLLTCSWSNVVQSDDQGRDVGLVSMVEDLSERADVADRIVHMTRHDALTGLTNRDHLLNLLDHALQQTRLSNGQLAIALITQQGQAACEAIRSALSRPHRQQDKDIHCTPSMVWPFSRMRERRHLQYCNRPALQ